MKTIFNHTYGCYHHLPSNSYVPRPPAHPLFLLNPGSDPSGESWSSHIALQQLEREQPGLIIVDQTNYTPEEATAASLLYQTIIRIDCEQRILRIPEMVDHYQEQRHLLRQDMDLWRVHRGDGIYGYTGYIGGMNQLCRLLRTAPVVLVCDCRWSCAVPCPLRVLAKQAKNVTRCQVYQMTWPYKGYKLVFPPKKKGQAE